MNDDTLMAARLALALLDRLAALSTAASVHPAAGVPDEGAADSAADGVLSLAGPSLQPGRVVLISSARAGEGKSFVAGLLHAALAAQPPYVGRVALVDGHMLSGRLTADDKPLAASAALLFQPAAVRQALAALRNSHALTLVDGAPLADCGALAHEVDALLLVVDAGRTPRRSIERALANARVDAARLAGVVLNRREGGLPRWLGAD